MGVNSTGGEKIGLADVDVSTLTLYELHDFRRELTHAILNPGIEFDEVGDDGESDRTAYKAKLEQVDEKLASMTDEPSGGNLP